MKNLSIIIPAYNEQGAIAETIKGLKKELSDIDLNYEIIVVNDGSTDKTKKILEKISGIKLINHPYNKGYGASLKTGVRNAKSNLLMFFDGDGQHLPENIPNFLKHIKDFDMVSGALPKKGYKVPYIRRPGKKLLHLIANYLTGMKIPDVNRGLRIVRKNDISKFLHILPNGFSFSTTTMLAFIKDGLSVKFVPIKIKKRIGKSAVKPKDAPKMLLLILRIILLFSPLKIFLPVSIFFFILGIASLIQNLIVTNISDVTVLLLISGMLIFFFGLLADQNSAIRREMKR